MAVLAGMAGAEGAYYNVLINLESLQELDQSAEPDFLAETLGRAQKAMARCEELAAEHAVSGQEAAGRRP